MALLGVMTAPALQRIAWGRYVMQHRAWQWKTAERATHQYEKFCIFLWRAHYEERTRSCRRRHS